MNNDREERSRAIANRSFFILGGLLLTYAVGLSYLTVRFHPGLAPAPFLASAYLFGLFVGLACAALLQSPNTYRLFLLAGTISLIGVIVSSKPQFFFWFGAIPCLGALAATLPTTWRITNSDGLYDTDADEHM